MHAKTRVLLFLFFLSGFTSLVYEVLWLRQLRQLFGSTAAATATTLTVFFLGLALGGYFWGKKAPGIKNHLRVWALLELGIGLTASLYFLMFSAFQAIYAPLMVMAGQSLFWVILVKFILALILLLPPAWFMGGTLPLIGHLLVQKQNQLSTITSLFYAVNTLGATFGALAAGFYLPRHLGFTVSYMFAISLNLLVAAGAFHLGRFRKSPATKPERLTTKELPSKRITLLIFASGFLALGLEVLWTLMLAQVVTNDVYSFSVILTVFLAALAVGGFLSHLLAGLPVNPWRTIYVLLVLSGILVGASPWVFYHWTGGLEPITAQTGWTGYLLSVFTLAGGTIFIPGIAIGMIFPYLLKLAWGLKKTVGETLGLWISVNTAGGILGSLVAGFLLVNYLGLWQAMAVLAGIYLVLSVVMVEDYVNGWLKRGLVALVLVMVFSVIVPHQVSLVRLNADTREVLLAKFTGSDGVVSVISSHPEYYPSGYDDLFIRLNNHYTLGGVGSLANEQRQAHLPLLLHPAPRSVFFLGMGTGITAGAALDHSVDEVVVTEVVPEVVVAARQYFEPFSNSLFTNSRVKVVIEDGRNYLLATPEKYDVIVGDIFNPWATGTGSLYTKEHFESVRDSLNEGGIFAQWLPLYQLTKQEFGIITRTFLDVFPQVTLWRGNFVPDKPVVALIGQISPSPLVPERLISNTKALGEQEDEVLIDALISVKGLGVLVVNPESKELLVQLLPHLSESVPFTFYAGNLTANQGRFSDYAINTDDRPLIEFLAPKAWGEQTGEVAWFTGLALERFFEELISQPPPEEDPYLKELTPEQLGYAKAGLSYYRSVLYEFVGQQTGQLDKLETGRRWFDDYLEKMELDNPSR